MIVEQIAGQSVTVISQNFKQLSKVEQSNTRQEIIKTQALWQQIQSVFSEHEVTSNILQDFKHNPNDEIVQAIFRHQLSVKMKDNSKLRTQLTYILSS